MSTWTSRGGSALSSAATGALATLGAARGAVALLLALSACVAGSGPRSVTVGEGAQAFVVAAPAGYCTAPRAVTRTDLSAFAAFARCTEGTGPSPLLTATVAEPGSAAAAPDPVALAAFFTATDGRRVLSRVGDPFGVTVHEVLTVDGAVLIRLTDAAPPATATPARATVVSETAESWRAVMTAGTRLVTLSVTPAPGAPLTRAEGRALATGFVAAVRRANAGGV